MLAFPFKSARSETWEDQVFYMSGIGANPITGCIITLDVKTSNLHIIFMAQRSLKISKESSYCSLPKGGERNFYSIFTKDKSHNHLKKRPSGLFLYPCVAQLVEHLVEAQGVGSANLSARTNSKLRNLLYF